MNRELTRKTLAEYARSNMPPEATIDLWPGIRNRLTAKKEVARPHVLGRVRRPMLAGAVAAGVVLAVVAALAFAWTATAPRPASAAEILSRVSGAATGAGDIRSTHAIVDVKTRNTPAEQFTTGVQEWWDEAPDKSRTDYRPRVPGDPTEWYLVTLKVDDTRYIYNANTNELRLDTITRAATTLGGGLGSAIGDATSIGRFNDIYDATLSGEEERAGRPAYVLDLTVKPTATINVAHPRKRVWVDKAAYLILGEQDWDGVGNLLYEARCRAIEINPNLDPAIFNFQPPPDTKVIDRRTTPTPVPGK